MDKKYLSKVIFTFIVGVTLGIGTFTAFAGVAEGSWKYYGPTNGYSYKNIARVYVSDNPSNGYMYAQTYAGKDGTGTVPTGYIGAQARLYRYDALVTSTNTVYNSSAAEYLSVCTSTSYNGGTGSYYSKGTSYAYNGNGYTSYSTYQSPSQTY
ncbi:MAG: hypothetical protein N3I35_16210 [Clostridia bacterium]|nr:hypothetical protein [Clostridia bacterium]